MVRSYGIWYMIDSYGTFTRWYNVLGIRRYLQTINLYILFIYIYIYIYTCNLNINHRMSIDNFIA